MEKLIQLRQRIAALQAERTEIDRQKRSREEVKSAMDTWLSSAEQQGREALHLALERVVVGQAFTPCHVHGTAAVFDSHCAAPLSLDLGPLLVMILGKAGVKKSLCVYLDGLPEGLDPESKASRLAEIEGELYQLETEEEARIVELEDAGEYFLRRPDARPEIILA